MFKLTKIFALTLLASLLLIAVLNSGMIYLKAQNQATVVILDSIGGTTEPAAGTHTFPAGTVVELRATPIDGFVFFYWIIATDEGLLVTENPTTITVNAGVTYAVEAVFQPLQVPPGGTIPTDMATAAIVIVLSAAGGTTSPSPGAYALANAEQLRLTAIPDNGWQFSHWVISGFPIEGAHGEFPFDPTPTDNPYTVDHGYGNTYNYQAVFTPIGGATPTPPGATPTPGPIAGLSTETAIIIVLVVVIIIILIAFGVYAARRRK